MILCRYLDSHQRVRIGLLEGERIKDLTAVGVTHLSKLLDADDPAARLTALSRTDLATVWRRDVRLLAPVDQQEVWAAGVTYLRSKQARMAESDFSARAYDEVYEAPRPELFFKALPSKVVGPGEPVGIRRDSTWTVPEPELALVFNALGRPVACTIGNDMSARDIEGQNLLYVPQAKIYNRSCALGPWLRFGADETQMRSWTIRLQIHRNGVTVFDGQTSLDCMRRRFDELADYLFRCQSFPAGAVLLTGTGLVPPDDVRLQAGDYVEISITDLGTLSNPVVEV
jgi:2-dehydro-3-deoxy-D-arabinonate dehydratase